MKLERTVLFLIALIIMGSGYSFAQTSLIRESMNRPNNSNQTRDVSPVYLDKNDPLFVAIKGRVIADLKQKTDTASVETKLIAARINALTKEKQTELETIFVKSINDYNFQTRFEPGIFMLHFKELQEKEPKELEEEYNFRLQNLGGNKYAAEFWKNDEPERNSKVMALLYILEKDGSITFRDPYKTVLDYIK